MAADRRLPPDIAARGMQDPDAERRASLLSQPVSRVIALRDPYEYPIPKAQPFVLNSGSVASIAAGTLSPAGLQMNLPKGTVARIDSVTIYITSLLDTTSMQYSLRIGGAPVLPALQFFPRAATSAGDNYPVFVRVPPQGKISMDIIQGDAGAYTVGAIITGWTFTVLAARRYLEYGE